MNNHRAAEITYAALRVVAGLLFLCHGGQKLFGWFGGLGGSGATAPLASTMGAAGVIELAGGLLLMVGLFTRPVAFLMAGEMAVAYFMSHAPHGFWPIVNHGEPAVLNCFIFLFYSAHGAGHFSLDALRHRGHPRIERAVHAHAM
jgi:putative oxidoreductase